MKLLTTASYAGPARNYSNSGRSRMYALIHATANDATAAEEASYAKRRTDGVSCHVVADEGVALQILDLDLDAHHVGSAWGNSRALAFELRGKNSWSTAYWRRVIDRVAPAVAETCRIYSIPVRHLTVEQARNKVMKGIVTHNDARLAWGGTTHTDPGPNFPMAYLLERVRAEMDNNMAETKATADFVKSSAYRLLQTLRMEPDLNDQFNAIEPNKLVRTLSGMRVTQDEILRNTQELLALAKAPAPVLDYEQLAKALLREMATA